MARSLAGAVPEFLLLWARQLDKTNLTAWGLSRREFGRWPSLSFNYRFAFFFERDWQNIIVNGEEDTLERVESSENIWQKWLHTFESYPRTHRHIFFAMSDPVQTGFVYLFKGKELGLYKTGFTSKEDAYARKASGQTFSAEELIPAGHFRAASKRTEKVVHELFAANRVRGEWFALTEQDIANLLDEEWRIRNNIF